MAPAAIWDPTQYHRFGDLRLRPALELLARVSVDAPRLVHDLGTGRGDVARLMSSRWPDARVIASDKSPEMLAEARAEESSVEWLELDIASWQPRPEHDLIYSNAVLHWLPDHAELLPRLAAGLVAGGQLAVQMPLSWHQPSHEAMRDTLESMSGDEAKALADHMSRPNVGHPDDYHHILRPAVSAVDIWETTYHQVLSGPDPVFAWMMGSILRPVVTQLPAEDLELFAARCRDRLRAAYPPRRDGTTLFPFRRLFIVATR